MAYIGLKPDFSAVKTTKKEFNFIATGGETVLSGNDNNGLLLEYNTGTVEVYFNGVRLEDDDFTATDGSTISLTNAATASDQFSIITSGSFTLDVTDVVYASTGGSFSGNIGVTGDVTSTGYIQFGSLTTTQRNALTAVNGMVIYNSTNNKFEGYQNGAWINLDDGNPAT